MHHDPCCSNCVLSDMFIASNYMRYGHSPEGGGGGLGLKPGMYAYRYGRLAYIFCARLDNMVFSIWMPM